MKHVRTVTPGHKYDLLNHEDPQSTPPQRILFIKKEKQEGTDELVTVHNGTTNEALLEVLIDRLRILDKKLSSKYNKKAIGHLEKALEALEERTADREERDVEGTDKK